MSQEEFIKYLVNILIYPDNFEINELGSQEFYKDNKLYFEYNPKTDVLFCSRAYVWDIFKEKYRLNDQEIIVLLKGILVNTFNMSKTLPIN